MPTPNRVELMPGVWLTHIQTEQFQTACWSLQLLCPLSAETAALYAALPKALCRGTARYPTPERLGEALARLGGGPVRPTAARFGEVQSVGFRGSFPDDRRTRDERRCCDDVAQLMGDLLLHPVTRSGRLTAGAVEAARGELLAEQEALCHDRLALARARLLEKLYRGDPYALGALGTSAGAKKVTQIRANRGYQALLPGVHVEVCYCGSLSLERVEQAWRQALRGLPRAIGEGESDRIPDTDTRTTPLAAPRTFTGEAASPLLTAALCVGGAVQGGRTLPLLLLEDLLRQRTPGVTATELDSVKGLLLVQLEAGAEGLAALEQSLDGLRQGGVTGEQLEAAQNRLAQRFLACSDHPERLVAYWEEQNATGRRTTPEQTGALVYTVSGEQLAQAARLTALDGAYLLTPASGGAQEDAPVSASPTGS